MPVFHADDATPLTEDQKQNTPGVPRAPLPQALQGKPAPPTTLKTVLKGAEELDPTGVVKTTRQYGTEAAHQVKGIAEGVGGVVKTAGQLASPFSSGPERIKATQALESVPGAIVKPPIRALKGQPQEGYPEESKPEGIARATDAADLIFGGDPGRARLLQKEGNLPGAVAAYTTGPLLFKGASKVAEELIPGGKTKPPFGPQPKSSVPELRENVAPNASATAERVARTVRPGKYLPNEYDRVKKLASVVGVSDKVNVPEALKAVMPELDKTAREYAIPPKGIVATEGVTERPGSGVNPSETLNSLMETTMGRLEQDYQKILGPAGSNLVSTNPVADAIAAQKTPGLIDLAAASPTSEAAKTVKYLDEAEAVFRNKMLPLRSIDDLRQYYYTAARAGEAGRVAARSNEAVMADNATGNALRDVIYGDLETRARAAGKDPGFIRDLKTKQAKLYSLLDLGKPNATNFINKEAVDKGFGWLQNQHVTAGVHPPMGRLVGTIHGLWQKLTGEPESLVESEKRVRQSFAQKGVPNTRTGKAAQSAAKGAKTATATATAGAVPQRTPSPERKRKPIPTESEEEKKKRKFSDSRSFSAE